MKYNLKNRPKYGDEGYRHVVYEKWFEGFKKELQYFYDNSVTMTDEERKLIKEILGEIKYEI